MPEQIKRLNYYDQQFLQEADFTDEQKYHLQMRRRLNRTLHTSGVVEGLVVTKKNDQEITLSPGLALDTTGREIILLTAADIMIDTSSPGSKYVTIQYTEEQTDPPPPEYMINEGDRTRWTEGAMIEVLDAAPADPGAQIILAELTIDNSIIEEITDGTPPNRRRVTGERSVLEYADKAAAKVNERIFQDRRQFVPLLAFSLKGVEYRDGRNVVIETDPGPLGVAFDGSNMWVGHHFQQKLSKIDVMTNTVVATVALGARPIAITFDGSHIWVTHGSSDTVSKIDIMANTVVATVPVSGYPIGIAFDGSHLWVTNTSTADYISKIDIMTNTVVTTVDVGNNPLGIVFDGLHIWVTNSFSNNISKIDIMANTVVATVPVSGYPLGITFDGSHLWVANAGADTISKIDIMTNTLVATVSVGKSPLGIAFDGSHIWVVNSGADSVSKIDITTNTVVATIPIGDQARGSTVINDNPVEIAFDGSHIWVANYGSNNVNKILI